MYSPRGMAMGCGFLLLIVACLVLVFPAYFMPRANPVKPSEAGIGMVQPAGRDPERDFQFSQVNKNNSEANHNNAQAQAELARATAIVVVSAAQAEKLQAESCDIRNDCNSGLNVKDSIGLMASGAGVVLVVVVVAFIVFIIAKIAG